MSDAVNLYATMVFDDQCMKSRLPKDTYRKYQATVKEGKRLDRDCAYVIANEMKNWAIEKGATHYTHWFQPMTGITAEKHDAFIESDGQGRVIDEFSSKALLQGEPDASSFPSGGLRATFEARGYTGWDPTSYAFIKDGVLCIPSVFLSYNGEALDKKTPLLRSQEALSKHAVRILHLFGKKDVTRVLTSVGSEQEYFLIDKTLWDKRKDLIYTGRTLYGALPPKTQELSDHYFGVLKPKVSKFMKELNEELWKLGILAKTQHNEVAPSQHELAPIHCVTNIACDHNQLTMEVMKKVALRNGLVCLLHEKPFANINGSGKHNNFSLVSDQCENLFEPGETPSENAQFLLILAALVKAVDLHQDLLRISVATAGNDHRLGASEAPPAIISIFTGSELEEIIQAIIEDQPHQNIKKKKMKIGVDALPLFTQDTTDRNRTSPFAFTGNKFEFRMVGSQLSIAGPNTILNTILADVLDEFANTLVVSEDFNKDLHQLIKDTFTKHQRIIFNGNGYDDAWQEEAKRRGLLNLRTTPSAIPHLMDEKNIELFDKHKIFKPHELKSRMEVELDEYSKEIDIEAETMVNMARKNIIPSVLHYIKDLSDTIVTKQQLQTPLACEVEQALATRLNETLTKFYYLCEELSSDIIVAYTMEDLQAQATYYCSSILTKMKELRKLADYMEQNTAKEYWPFPSYGDLLYSVLE